MLSRIFRGRNREGQEGGVLRVFWQTFIRDNRIVPPVLAIVALLIFSWVVAGSFIGGQDDPVSSTQSVSPGGGGEVAQSDGGSAEATPEIENPNADSFAAYESKDPFRNLFTPANADTGEDVDDGNPGSGTDGEPSGDDSNNNDAQRTDPTDTPASNQYDNGQQNDDGGSGGQQNDGGGNGGSGNTDSDGDGISDDLDEDSGDGSGDGVDDNLFDSGGTLPDPGR